MELVGLRPAIIEKVDRISDILVRVGKDPLLRKTLCLYGGTALNFLHFPDTPRLSEDLDFNYRHTSERDRGDVRSEVDEHIKGILHGLGYGDDQFKIQPRYNIGRFHVKYTNRDGVKDSLKIEIGYSRRMPILREDARRTRSGALPLTSQYASISVSSCTLAPIIPGAMIGRCLPGMHYTSIITIIANVSFKTFILKWWFAKLLIAGGPCMDPCSYSTGPRCNR